MHDDDYLGLMAEEASSDVEDYDADFVDEDSIKGRTKRGNNKTAVKNTKGLAGPASGAGAGTARDTANKKSPQKAAGISPKKSATPRSAPNATMTVQDWEIKLQLSTNQQTTGNYTLEPVSSNTTAADTTAGTKAPQSASPKPSTTVPRGDEDEAGSDVKTMRTRSRPGPVTAAATPPKKDVSSSKTFSAWDDKDPWA